MSGVVIVTGGGRGIGSATARLAAERGYAVAVNFRRMSTRHGGPGGAIVNLSSTASRLGSAGEYVDYAASKAAIDTFTLGLAREVAGEGIRVNAVRPGIIQTEIHASVGDPDRPERLGAALPMGRVGLAEEVARAVRCWRRPRPRIARARSWKSAAGVEKRVIARSAELRAILAPWVAFCSRCCR